MKRALSLLVVDDDSAVRKSVTDMLRSQSDLVVDEACDGTQALEMICQSEFDAAIVDINMPQMGGMKLLEEARKIRPALEIVMITGFGSIESAVQAMRLGATDYVTKPFKLAQIRLVLDRLRKVRALACENEILRQQLRAKFRAESMVGLSPEMNRINELIDKLRSEDCTVLLLGESGTGKELIARAIHFEGNRGGKLFVPVNCAAISKNLLESELFGHEKGAFTGAHARKEGLFERAQGGTLFLDEIAEIPLELQASLLRALEEKKVRPVGSTAYVDVDGRIIAATNRDIEEMVRQGHFRRDLFFRLNVVTLRVPPLRSRKDDIPLLVQCFIKRHAPRSGRSVEGITDEALETLLDYDWPGNVRELEHVIERAAALGGKSKIESQDLPPSLLEKTKRRRKPEGRSLKEIEAGEIRRLLTECRGDTARVAGVLKIDRSTLYRKMRRYKIDPSESEE